MPLEAYRLSGEIARGGMGVVLRATSPEGRDVAIKVLKRPQEMSKLQRFERERRLLELLGEDEGFVPVLEQGESSRGPYIVMPYLPGGSLRERLDQRKRLSIASSVELVKHMAKAAGEAHARGIVHRDLKPANVLFSRSGKPLLADLGLAKHFRRDVVGASESLSLTAERTLTGTMGYMAPEQMRDSASADPRADVFALGAILYECLAGRAPFGGSRSFIELLTAVNEGRYEPLSSLRPEVPAPLEDLVARCLAVSAEQRFGNGSELARALDEVRLDASPSPMRSREPTWPDTPSPASASTAPPVRAPGPPRRWVAPALLGAGGAVAVFVAIWVTKAQADASHHAQLVAQVREQIASLEQQARLLAPHEALEAAATSLRSHAPPDLLADVDLAWGQILFRRGRSRAARAAVESLAGVGGARGLEARRIVASALLDEKDANRAEPLLASLEQGPDVAFADWARLRRAAARSGETPGLEAERARVEKGDDPASLELLAELAIRAHQTSWAKKLFERTLQLAHDEAKIYVLRAALARGRLDFARLRSEADADAHADVAIFFRLAGPEGERVPEALWERARTELARREHERALRDLDAAIDAGFQGSDVDAARAWFLDERGRQCAARVKALDVSDALPPPPLRDRLDMAAVVTPSTRERLKARASTAQEAARAALEEALVASARGEPEAPTLAAFEQAKALAPRCPVVATERARFLVSRGKGAEALSAIVGARALPGANASELLLLEMDHAARRGRRADARDAANAILRESPTGFHALLARSYLAEDARKAEDAEDLARKAAALAPERGWPRIFVGAALLGSSVPPSRVEAEAREALALDGRLDLEAYFLGVYSGDVSVMERSTAPGPDEVLAVRSAIDALVLDFPTARALRERANLRQGLGENGDDDLAKARELDPGSPLVEEDLGFKAFYDRHDAATAREHWRRARAIDPRWTIGKESADEIGRTDPSLKDEFGQQD